MALSDSLIQEVSHLSTGEVRDLLDKAGFAELLKEPAASPHTHRRGLTLGKFQGQHFYMAEDFDAPLPDEFWLGKDDGKIAP